ncbi:APC family permease [Alloalcanivorax gelatiniphagus]
MTATRGSARVDLPAEPSLTGRVGVVGVATMVVSAAAPLMVLAGVAPLALGIAGSGAALGYLLAGLVLGVFSVGFTTMCARVPRNGAFHVYVEHAFGRRAGVTAAAVALVSYNALQVGVWGLFALQVQSATGRLLDATPPWWAVALTGVVLVHAVARLGISVGVRLLCVLVGLECLLLGVLSVAVLAEVGPNSWSWSAFEPAGWLDARFFAVLGICFAAFMGFESTALYRAEARRPGWTIPRATFAAIGFMAVFDFFVVWAVPQAYAGSVDSLTDGSGDGVKAAAGEHGAALFLVVAREHLGVWAESTMFVLIVTSAFASQLAFHNAINRYTHTLAREGLLPSGLSRTDRRFGSPYVAGRAQSSLALLVVAAVALAGADPYEHLLLWVNTPGIVGILALEATVAAAAAVWLRRHFTSLAACAEGRPRFGGAIVASSWMAAVLLAAVLVLLIANLSLFSNAGLATNLVLLAVIPVTAVVAYIASRLRARQPTTGTDP